VKRGDIYWVDLEPTRGSEGNKLRPCVIVSRDASNRVAPILTVVPITSNIGKVYPFDVALPATLDRPSKAQANQVRTVSKDRLSGSVIARLSPEETLALEAALRLHLAL
jgi:mRNA interferase MazF